MASTLCASCDVTITIPRKPGSGRRPVTRNCKWCSSPFSARDMRKHVVGCKRSRTSVPAVR
jgi:hypothetical protein